MATPLYELRRQARDLLLEPYVLVTPGTPLVSVQGTPATAEIHYAIVARNATGTSKASAEGITLVGSASLTGTDFNELTWTPVPGAASYDIYRTQTEGLPSSTGLIANTSDTTLQDIGLPGDNAAVPTINTSGVESPFWNDEDLTISLVKGAKDLWKAIIDLHQNHFTTIDESNCSIVSGSSSVAGVPADCFRILSIEPRDLTYAGSQRNLGFKPRKYQSEAFQNMRALSGSQGTDWDFVYDLLNAGSPVAAPTIKIAPTPTSTILLRLVYVHTLPALTEADDNPIPGESDHALVAWCVAFALSRQTEGQQPDPGWLSIYATEKQGLLTALTPRQEQEPEYVQGMFEEYW